MGLKEFQLRLSERSGLPLAALSKAVHPDDFTAILAESAPEGPATVDHVPDLSAHPPSHNARVLQYNDMIAHQTPMSRKVEVNLAGLTAKAMFLVRHPTQHKLERYIVKPYHEVIVPMVKFWQHHHIQGWAEMTNQALWHAADMGHMHQQVHVSEHPMGLGHEREPGLVIKMEPTAGFAKRLTAEQYSTDMHADLPKIAVMDFLSNNLDRHRNNLMFMPVGSVDDNSQSLRSRILAIDHGRSFQYHASNRGPPKFIQDALHGPLPVDAEVAAEYAHEGKSGDNLIPYVFSHGIREFADWGRKFGEPPLTDPSFLALSISRWWPSVRNNVVSALHKRLESLREPRMREHINRNFNERVALLDKIAADPRLWRKAKFQDFNVPLYVWDR